MTGVALQTMTQIALERVVNTLPEGLLIAVFAWVLLRLLPRQNSGTRFAVWFAALLTVSGLPVVGGLPVGQMLAAWVGASGGVAMVSGGATERLRAAVSLPERWAVFALVAWMLGAAVGLTRLAAGLRRLRQLSRGWKAIELSELSPAVRTTVETIGELGAVKVVSSESVRVPAAIGLGMRAIVLPEWTLRELAAEDLNVVLLHEYAHLRRGDDWTNLVQKIVRAIFFFHPAVWWIENRLAVEREMACDDAVLAETANPHGYASCLVSLLEKSLAHRVGQGPVPDKRLEDKRWAMAHGAVNRAQEAAARLAQILDAKRPVATRVWKPALGMVGAFFVVCMMVLPQAPELVAFERGAGEGLSSAAEVAGKVDLRSAATKGAFDSGEYAVSLKRYPDTKLERNPDVKQSRNSDTRPERNADVKKEQNLTKRVPRVDGSTAVVAEGRDAGRAADFAGAVAASPRAAMEEQGVENGAVVSNARADEQMVPEVQTLMFVEATPYGNPESPVWSVQVWRVTFVSLVRERMARVPVANSI